jgi:hypothetical protein
MQTELFKDKDLFDHDCVDSFNNDGQLVINNTNDLSADHDITNNSNNNCENDEEEEKRQTKRRWFFIVIRDEETMPRFRSTNMPVVEWPTRQQVFDIIYQEHSNKCEFFVVALEREHEIDHRHFHILICLKNKSAHKQTINQVLEWFKPISHKHRRIWFDTKEDVDHLKYRSRALAYVSKQDCDLLYYNIRDTSEFHLRWIFINEYCRVAHKTDKRQMEFNVSDLCTINVNFEKSSNIWEQEFTQFKRDTVELVPHRLANAKLLYGWHKEFAQWYNSFLCLSYQYHQFTKRPQVYLWGDTNVGKTEFVKWFFRQNEYHGQVFRPAKNTTNHSTYEQWDSKLFTVVVDDEFKIDQQSASIWKQAIEQAKFKQAVRYHPNKDIQISVPYVIISNIDPEDWFEHIKKKNGEHESRSLRSRLKIIKAERFPDDQKYYRLLSNSQPELKARLNPIRLGTPIDVYEEPLPKRMYAYKPEAPKRPYKLNNLVDEIVATAQINDFTTSTPINSNYNSDSGLFSTTNDESIVQTTSGQKRPSNYVNSVDASPSSSKQSHNINTNSPDTPSISSKSSETDELDIYESIEKQQEANKEADDNKCKKLRIDNQIIVENVENPNIEKEKKVDDTPCELPNELLNE